MATANMKRVNQVLTEAKTTSFANMIEGGRSPLLSATKLQELGYNVVAYLCGSVFVAVKAFQD
jgi:methylisocitrate lyase